VGRGIVRHDQHRGLAGPREVARHTVHEVGPDAVDVVQVLSTIAIFGSGRQFDFRYSHRIKLGVDDTEPTRLAIKGAGGKRLTCRRTRTQAQAA
jgi:hypothetical protein